MSKYGQEPHSSVMKQRDQEVVSGSSEGEVEVDKLDDIGFKEEGFYKAQEEQRSRSDREQEGS